MPLLNNYFLLLNEIHTIGGLYYLLNTRVTYKYYEYCFVIKHHTNHPLFIVLHKGWILILAADRKDSTDRKDLGDNGIQLLCSLAVPSIFLL